MSVKRPCSEPDFNGQAFSLTRRLRGDYKLHSKLHSKFDEFHDRIAGSFLVKWRWNLSVGAMQERTDQRWVRALKEEDPTAITDLWEKLFLWSLTLTRKYNQAEDIGRDGAVAAYWRIMQRGIYQYKFQGPFLGFCRRILVNEVNRRLKETPYMADIDDPAVHHPSEEIADPIADAATIRARLQPCFDDLKERERQIITLLYMQNRTPETVAEELGISRQNTNVIAFRARGKLQDCLRGQGYTDSLEVLSA